MSGTTKQKLVGQLVGWGHVVLLVDSFATRGIDHDCFKGILAIARISDALGALAFLAGQTFVDPQRVAAVGFSKGGWTALLVSESNDSLALFVRPSNLKFRAAVAFNPPCRDVGARPLIPTLILIGTLDEWTPAAHCSEKVDAWGTDGTPIDLVVYLVFTMDFTTRSSSPGGPCLVAGWNTTRRQPRMQADGCENFSSAT